MSGTIRFTVDSDEGAALAALIDNPRITGYVTLLEGTYIEREGPGRFPLFLVTPDRDFTISGCGSVKTDDLFNATIELIVSKTSGGHPDASDECRKILVDVV